MIKKLIYACGLIYILAYCSSVQIARSEYKEKVKPIMWDGQYLEYYNDIDVVSVARTLYNGDF